jgi:hypothetical protein
VGLGDVYCAQEWGVENGVAQLDDAAVQVMAGLASGRNYSARTLDEYLANMVCNTSCIREVVLPKPNNEPLATLEMADYGPVAVDVPRDLFRPERSVRCWYGTMFRAAVPEASINKHYNSCLPEYKIGLTE